MALPAGLATFTLTGGAFTDATGAVALAGVVGSLIPVDGAGRPSPVLHPSTGKLIVPAAVPITVAGDGTWSVGPLPYTNDPAFAAPFRYSVSWNVSSLGATPGDRIIEVPTGSGSVIDYDLMGSSIGSPVTPVAVPLVTSVAGVTGAVTGAQIAADAALRAAFVPFWAAGETVTAGTVRMAPDGHVILSNSSRTTRGSYDTTEQGNWTVIGGGSGSAALVPTATKTASYTAAVGDLAMMNVAAGASTLTLPTAPVDKAQVGYRAIGATTNAPLTVNRGGSADTIGTTGATSATVPLADETLVYQYDAANTRWLAVANVKTKTSLDATYAGHGETSQNLATALPVLMAAIRSNNDSASPTLRIIGGGSSVGSGATLPSSATQAPVQRFATQLAATINKLGNLVFATTNGSVIGTTITDFNLTSYAAAKTTAGGTPTVVVFAFGMNDGMPAQYHAGQTYPGVYTGLKAAILAVQNDGGDPIVITSPHPHSTRAPWADTSWGTPSYPSATAVPALTQAASVVTADWSGTGKAVPASYRHLRVNQAMRQAALALGVPVIDAERYWFKALANYSEDSLFNVGEYVHPNLLGHQQSYWMAIDDFMRGLSAPTVQAPTPPRVRETFAVRGSNLVVNNSTTPVSDTQLQVPVGAGQVWAVEYDVFYATNVTADLKIGIVYPTGCTGSLAVIGVGPGATANGDVARFQRSPLSGTSLQINVGGNTQDGWAKMRALIRVGSTAGNVTFQAAQTTADPSNTMVYADSSMRATRIS